jgi:hypothetical protein
MTRSFVTPVGKRPFKQLRFRLGIADSLGQHFARFQPNRFQPMFNFQACSASCFISESRRGCNSMDCGPKAMESLSPISLQTAPV